MTSNSQSFESRSVLKTFKDLPVGATFFLFDDVVDPWSEFRKVDHKSGKRVRMINNTDLVEEGVNLPFHDKEMVVTLRAS